MEIPINGVIGIDVTASDVRQQLKKAKGEDVTMVVNTPGGLLFEAFDIFNQFKNYKGEVKAVLSGAALSAGSYIPMSADEIEVEANGVLMMHNVQGCVCGDHNDMERQAGIQQKLSSVVAAAYAKHMKRKKSDIAKMMNETTFLFGDEIVESGFANKMVGDEVDADKDEMLALAQAAYTACEQKIYSDQPKMADDLNQACVAMLGKKGQAKKLPQNKEKRCEMNLDELKSSHPELVEAITNEARQEMGAKVEEARLEGAKAERDRITAVLEQTVPGHEKLVNEMAFDGKTTGEQAAVKVLKAVKEDQVAALEKFEDDAPDPVKDQPEKQLTGEEKLKAEWDKNPGMQAEYAGDYDVYKAYHEEQEGIKIKSVGGK